jgi:hypothetical protein
MILPYYLLSNDLRSRNITVDCKDLNYQVLDSSISDRFVKAIRKFDELLNEFSREYEYDFWDCDDFALLFKSVCGLYGFTCGYAEGRVYINNQFVGLHAFNIIPYYVSNNVVWLVVEPQIVGVRGFNWYQVLPPNGNKVNMLTLYIYEVNYVWL